MKSKPIKEEGKAEGTNLRPQAPLHLSLTEDEKAHLERIARANERTLVGQVRYWIRQEASK